MNIYFQLRQKCSENQFRCYSGECLDLKMKCNNQVDCLYGEDENVDMCSVRIVFAIEKYFTVV